MVMVVAVVVVVVVVAVFVVAEIVIVAVVVTSKKLFDIVRILCFVLFILDSLLLLLVLLRAPAESGKVERPHYNEGGQKFGETIYHRVLLSRVEIAQRQSQTQRRAPW